MISIPKCGTTALQKGFERIGHSTIHVHNNFTTYEAFINGDMLRRAGIGVETLVMFRRYLSAEPIHIFCGYREPVSWYLSLAGHFGMPFTEDLREKIVGNLRYEYPWNRYKFGDTRRVVEYAAGVKLFAENFDASAGYTILRNGNIHVVLYRLDRMGELENYIKENIDNRFEMKMERVNRDDSYVDFVKRFRLPVETLMTLFSCKVFSYFYDQAESAQLVSKYLG